MAAVCLDNADSLYDYVVVNGNGVKGLADSGIEKVPERYIQPSSEQIEKLPEGAYQQYASPIDLSLLDGPHHDEVVEAIVGASRSLGFFQVVNHGVPVDLLESLKQSSHRFFAQTAQKKAVYLPGVSPSPLVKYGTSFNPDKEKALEWKDYISMVYSNDAEVLELWPKECKEEVFQYLTCSIKMVRRLLEILFDSLEVKLEESRLDSITGLKMVNMNFYPACPNPELTVGVGRHSDMGTLTVLLQDGIGGLQVKAEEDLMSGQKEEWIEIPPCPNALVINVGDALQILSNGRFRSAEHRVRTAFNQSRVSVPFFTAPGPAVKIGPLPELVQLDGMAHYREVLFQDYMKNFFGKAHDGKKSLDFVKSN